MCIATFKDNTHWAKLANHGTPGNWVSYADNHPTSTYWIFNPKTKCIILTYNVTFLHKSYGEYCKVEKPVILPTSYEGLDNEEEPEIVSIENNDNGLNVVSNSNSDSSDNDLETNGENLFDEDVDNEVIASPKTMMNAKVIQAMKELQAYYKDDANKLVKEASNVKVSQNLNFLIDLAMITNKSIPVHKAWNHPDMTSPEKWQDAICKEFANMNKQQVWCKTTESLMSPN